MKTTAIVLAAGSGKRMGTAVKKQYLNLGGHPVLFYSLMAFQNSNLIDDIILVCSKEDAKQVRSEYCNDVFSKISCVVEGGKERYNSVFNGLKAIKKSNLVFIHDGARPFVDEAVIERCYQTLNNEDACVAAVLSKDTVKIADEEGYVNLTPNRKLVWNVQTPQCFKYELILEAYNKLIEAEQNELLTGVNVTDDAMVAEHFLGTRVKLVEGSYNNIKITTIEDIALADKILDEINVKKA